MVFGGAGEGQGYTDDVILTKLSVNKEKLADAHFELRDLTTNKVVYLDLVTDNKSIVEVRSLVPGNYEFIKTQVPEGYKLNSTPLKFTIYHANNEQDLNLTMVDVLMPSSSKIVIQNSKIISSLSKPIVKVSSKIDQSSALKSSSQSKISKSSNLSSFNSSESYINSLGSKSDKESVIGTNSKSEIKSK